MARETAAQKREREAAEAAAGNPEQASQAPTEGADGQTVVNDDSTAGPNDNALSESAVKSEEGSTVDPAGERGEQGSGSADVDPPSGPQGEQETKQGPETDADRSRGADGNVGPAIYGDTGPNRDLPDAPPEDSARMPSTVLDTASSGPLEPPSDARHQDKPALGYDLSSTDHVYANVGGQTVAGETFDALVDEDGNTLDVDSVFTDDNPAVTFVTVGDRRVFEQFFYPNTTAVAKRLLYVPGQRVNRVDAERVKQAIRSHEQIAKG